MFPDAAYTPRGRGARRLLGREVKGLALDQTSLAQGLGGGGYQVGQPVGTLCPFLLEVAADYHIYEPDNTAVAM